jgi:hypothetical protein
MSKNKNHEKSSSKKSSRKKKVMTPVIPPELLTRREVLKKILQYATASAGALALSIFPENLHPSTIAEYKVAIDSQQQDRRR